MCPPASKSQKVNCWLDPPGHLRRAVIAREGGLGPTTHGADRVLSCRWPMGRAL